MAAALRSLTPDDRVETEHELAQATRARDGLRRRIAQLSAAGGQDVHLAKLRYQLDANERWIARYEAALVTAHATRLDAGGQVGTLTIRDDA